ncbi:hypothetical protein KC356_g153 [Hortaea werneckii]|nr:hypothetical protein KC356_g153 [Hortaea werneckii]
MKREVIILGYHGLSLKVGPYYGRPPPINSFRLSSESFALAFKAAFRFFSSSCSLATCVDANRKLPITMTTTTPRAIMTRRVITHLNPSISDRESACRSTLILHRPAFLSQPLAEDVDFVLQMGAFRAHLLLLGFAARRHFGPELGAGGAEEIGLVLHHAFAHERFPRQVHVVGHHEPDGFHNGDGLGVVPAGVDEAVDEPVGVEVVDVAWGVYWLPAIKSRRGLLGSLLLFLILCGIRYAVKHAFHVLFLDVLCCLAKLPSTVVGSLCFCTDDLLANPRQFGLLLFSLAKGTEGVEQPWLPDSIPPHIRRNAGPPAPPSHLATASLFAAGTHISPISTMDLEFYSYLLNSVARSHAIFYVPVSQVTIPDNATRLNTTVEESQASLHTKFGRAENIAQELEALLQTIAGIPCLALHRPRRSDLPLESFGAIMRGLDFGEVSGLKACLTEQELAAVEQDEKASEEFGTEEAGIARMYSSAKSLARKIQLEGTVLGDVPLTVILGDAPKGMWAVVRAAEEDQIGTPEQRQRADETEPERETHFLDRSPDMLSSDFNPRAV